MGATATEQSEPRPGGDTERSTTPVATCGNHRHSTVGRDPFPAGSASVACRAGVQLQLFRTRQRNALDGPRQRIRVLHSPPERYRRLPFLQQTQAARVAIQAAHRAVDRAGVFCPRIVASPASGYRTAGRGRSSCSSRYVKFFDCRATPDVFAVHLRLMRGWHFRDSRSETGGANDLAT